MTLEDGNSHTMRMCECCCFPSDEVPQSAVAVIEGVRFQDVGVGIRIGAGSDASITRCSFEEPDRIDPGDNAVNTAATEGAVTRKLGGAATAVGGVCADGGLRSGHGRAASSF